jgi:hypothetical protein
MRHVVKFAGVVVALVLSGGCSSTGLTTTDGTGGAAGVVGATGSQGGTGQPVGFDGSADAMLPETDGGLVSDGSVCCDRQDPVCYAPDGATQVNSCFVECCK